MDKKEKKKHNQGISLKKFNIAMFLLALVITAVMFVAMHRTSKLYDEAHYITDQTLTLRQSAYDMQLASDYLTEQIRCFAITGDREYLKNYFEEANVTRRRENALDKIKRYQGENEAFKSLNEAMIGSLDLMNVEYYAALLTISAYGYDRSEFPELPGSIELTAQDESRLADEKKKVAINMLFDNAYKSKKDYISNNMDSCLADITGRMGEQKKQLDAELKRQVNLEHVLTELLIAIMLGIVIATTILVINPIMGFVDLIREQKPIPPRGAFEVRFLAKNYNLIYYANMEDKKQLEYDANHDKLTGLFNRRGYDLLVSNLDVQTSAMMLVDLDYFKKVNDTFGHDMGDKVLTRVSEVLLKAFRQYAYICRLGGDEFVVLFIHTDRSTRSSIEKKIKKINEKLSKPSKGMPVISVSAGVAFGRKGMTSDDLFKEADLALYDVKEHGRSNISVRA